MNDSQYLLRFDDICPTMNWSVWEVVEANLLRYGVKPIMAVIPDNQDPKLMWDPPMPDFWDRVRRWQEQGWAIALHGYQHIYVNKNPGLMRLTKQSEFAGLSLEVQEAKLRSGLAIFAAQGVRADAWIGPSHSFDRTTVELLHRLGVPVICDGLWPWPFRDHDGMIWVPQQLWEFDPKRSGVWTVCNHHNSWTDQHLAGFEGLLSVHAAQMTDLASVVQRYGHRRLTLLDRWTAFYDLVFNHRRRAWHTLLRQRLRSLGSASR